MLSNSNLGGHRFVDFKCKVSKEQDSNSCVYFTHIYEYEIRSNTSFGMSSQCCIALTTLNKAFHWSTLTKDVPLTLSNYFIVLGIRGTLHFHNNSIFTEI